MTSPIPYPRISTTHTLHLPIRQCLYPDPTQRSKTRMMANERHRNTLLLASLKNSHSFRDLVLVSVNLNGNKLRVGSYHSQPPSIPTGSEGTNRSGSEKGSSRHSSGKVTKHCSRELSEIISRNVETNCGRNHQFVLQSNWEPEKQFLIDSPMNPSPVYRTPIKQRHRTCQSRYSLMGLFGSAPPAREIGALENSS